jgi:hypothetical protein
VIRSWIAISGIVFLLFAAIRASAAPSEKSDDIITIPSITAKGVVANSTLVVQASEKPSGNNSRLDKGPLEAIASHKMFFDKPVDVVQLPPIAFDIGSLTFENGTEVPQEPIGIPSILISTSFECPANSTYSSVGHGIAPRIPLKTNVSGLIYYNYSMPDIVPDGNGTYNLAFWSFEPATIMLPADMKLYSLSQERCYRYDAGDIIFYDIKFGTGIPSNQSSFPRSNLTRNILLDLSLYGEPVYGSNVNASVHLSNIGDVPITFGPWSRETTVYDSKGNIVLFEVRNFTETRTLRPNEGFSWSAAWKEITVGDSHHPIIAPPGNYVQNVTFHAGGLKASDAMSIEIKPRT